jgi:hypothetical protein
VTLYSQGLVFSSLIQELAAAGAPGAMITGATGARFNPVHELARGFSQAFVQTTSAAIEAATWTVPTTPPVSTPGAAVAPAQVAILPAAVPGLAQGHAASLGWTGRASAVMFRGVYAGISRATSGSGKALTAGPDSATAPSGLIVQLQMPPLPVAGLAGVALANWAANPLLAGGGPGLRAPLATEWAKAANTCWTSIRPFISLVGSPTGVSLGPFQLEVMAV